MFYRFSPYISSFYGFYWKNTASLVTIMVIAIDLTNENKLTTIIKLIVFLSDENECKIKYISNTIKYIICKYV